MMQLLSKASGRKFLGVVHICRLSTMAQFFEMSGARWCEEAIELPCDGAIEP